MNIDASDVPSEYALTILSECAAFPRRLVFFLKGTLSVRCPMPVPLTILHRMRGLHNIVRINRARLMFFGVRVSRPSAARVLSFRVQSMVRVSASATVVLGHPSFAAVQVP